MEKRKRNFPRKTVCERNLFPPAGGRGGKGLKVIRQTKIGLSGSRNEPKKNKTNRENLPLQKTWQGKAMNEKIGDRRWKGAQETWQKQHLAAEKSRRKIQMKKH